MIIVTKYLIPKGYTGIALFPFIFVREAWLKENAVVVNHEKIHLRQQAEMLVLPFYLWYCTEFLLRFAQYRNRRKAYGNISFEREAYANEHDGAYLNRRRFWNFIKYL